MKKIILALVALLPILGQAQDFKVVGYLPSYRTAHLDDLNYDFYTHIIASFINPDTQGNMSWTGDIDNFVTKVHAGGAKAIVSYAGGGDYSWGSQVSVYEDLLQTPASRTAFIHKIMNYLRDHNLDGIDNDMEGYALELVNYNIFTQELGDSVHAAGLEFSAAYGVSGGNSNWTIAAATNATLEKYDFIGTMSYGGVSQWTWQAKENLHMTMKTDIQAVLARGVDKEAVVGGLPFYGLEYPNTAQQSYGQFNKTYCSLYNDSRLAAYDVFNTDTMITTDGTTVYNHSFKTFKDKIDYAKTHGGGIMIWEVGQECFDGSVSLTDSLHAYMEEQGILTTSNEKKMEFNLFPNPTSEKLTVQGSDMKSVKVFDMNGKLILNEFSNSKKQHVMNLNGYFPGIYFIEVESFQGAYSNQKLIVR